MSSHQEPAYMRYPLGLPAGSIRSVLSMMVVGLFCGLILMPAQEGKELVLPAYLVGLVCLVVISFLAAQGRSMNKGSGSAPLGLPRWTVRLLLIAALVGTIVYEANQDPDKLLQQVEETLRVYAANPWSIIYAVLFLLGGFALGHIAQMIFGVDSQFAYYQDVIAWIAIVAMVGMGAILLIRLVINFNLEEQFQVDESMFGSILGGIITFYFSARS